MGKRLCDCVGSGSHGGLHISVVTLRLYKCVGLACCSISALCCEPYLRLWGQQCDMLSTEPGISPQVMAVNSHILGVTMVGRPLEEGILFL